MKKLLTIIPLLSILFILSGCTEVNDFVDYLTPAQANPTCETTCEPVETIIYEDRIVYEETIIYEQIIETVTLPADYDLIIDTRDAIRESNIYIEAEQYSLGFRNIPVLETTSTGSGFLIHYEEGIYYALTNHHVLFSEDNIEESRVKVETLDGTIYEASIIAFDALNDIALIAFESTEVLPLIDIQTRLEVPLSNTEFLLAVGNPKGLLHVVTFGEFIDLRRIANVDYEVIYHSALIYSGNSGGALVDQNGLLVGMNTWSAFDSDVENYAIPLTIIHAFLEANFGLYDNIM